MFLILNVKIWKAFTLSITEARTPATVSDGVQ